MKLSWKELSPTAQTAVRYFNLILETNFWEDWEETERKLDQGERVFPHASMGWSNGSCQIQASLNAEAGMLTICLTQVGDKAAQVGLHFLYRDNLIDLLERLVDAMDWLRPGTYFQFANSLQGYCEEILVESVYHDQQVFSTLSS